ncbi:hypothetical protein QR680_017298 [Steinernema hermaphroditum]|uniref:uridine/cytidine kinase n=1 Tax=Steinernema hermaphroditum TaxID=289476 RepID=A0AA39LP38_9BILA|nr:hypothetical protein QR680_017298 [Steinernema hermaphroditum]
MDENAMSISSKIKVPFLIGVAGGTASGKSSVCARIMDLLGPNNRRVISISQDSFYRNLAQEENQRALRGDFNFDHPDAFEHPLMMKVLESLRNGKPQRIPRYDFKTNSRLTDEFDIVEPADVIIVEGILVFYDQKLRDMFNMKLFVDADSDIRLARRVERDTRDRGRTLSQVLHQYLSLVKPAFEEFCLPTKKYADVVIPRGVDNLVAIDLIVQHIQEILRSPRSSSSSSLTDIIAESGIHDLPLDIPLDPSGDHKCAINGVVSRPH